MNWVENFRDSKLWAAHISKVTSVISQEVFVYEQVGSPVEVGGHPHVTAGNCRIKLRQKSQNGIGITATRSKVVRVQIGKPRFGNRDSY